jgi:uncharacterized protein YecT (DUF1311 family)
MKPVVLIAAGLLCVGLSACDSESVRPAEGPSHECDRSDGSMPSIKACAGDDLAQEEARMQRYFAAAMKRARDNDAESVKYGPRTRQVHWLTKSQRDWKAYAESHCAVWLPDGSGGPIGGLFYATCLTDATWRRTRDIWGDYLTYMSETTPPVLPEPVRPISEDRTAEGSEGETSTAAEPPSRARNPSL